MRVSFNGCASSNPFRSQRKHEPKGFTALKFDPFDSGYLSMRRAEGNIAEERVKAVREAVGDDVELLMEFHGRLDAASAIEMGRRLEKYNPFFIEEPTPPENLDALAKVARDLPPRIATGERLYTRLDYRRLFPLQAADFIQPDLCHVGGILECKKIAALAEASSVRVAPHSWGTGALLAATYHFGFSTPNCFILEYPTRGFALRDELLANPFVIKDGYIYPPDGPGLGVKLTDEIIEKYPYRPGQRAQMERTSGN